jgi:hypothetical protein
MGGSKSCFMNCSLDFKTVSLFTLLLGAFSSSLEMSVHMLIRGPYTLLKLLICNTCMLTPDYHSSWLSGVRCWDVNYTPDKMSGKLRFSIGQGHFKQGNWILFLRTRLNVIINLFAFKLRFNVLSLLLPLEKILSFISGQNYACTDNKQ